MFYQESCQFVVSSFVGERIHPAVPRRSQRLKVRTERVCCLGALPAFISARALFAGRWAAIGSPLALPATHQIGLKQLFVSRLLVLDHCSSGSKDSFLETCRWVGESDRNLCQSRRSSSLRGGRDRSPSGPSSWHWPNRECLPERVALSEGCP